jgi:3-hydroxyisobutyrate dehydrogenase-like beta-hydroxyacid dehydrogenase
MTQIAFIGFGEAGGILAEELAARHRISIWDCKLAGEQRTVMQARARRAGVQVADSLAQALSDAELIFSTVTADAALEVAQEAASLLSHGQCFLDLNSVAPNTKRSAALAFQHATYIDVAVMAPVPPSRLATPMLAGGQGADALCERLKGMGLNIRYGGGAVGKVSAIKMCRSVMIKGLEALTTECLRGARKYGVEQEVLASLHASFPSLGWNDTLPDYLISRVAEHGRRRAAEMQEVVKMLQDGGMTGEMSMASAAIQLELVEAMAHAQLDYASLEPFCWQRLADSLET